MPVPAFSICLISIPLTLVFVAIFELLDSETFSLTLSVQVSAVKVLLIVLQSLFIDFLQAQLGN